MKKSLAAIAAIVALLSMAGCMTYGKQPVGKYPIAVKG